MRPRIRDPKDFWSGLFFLALGAGALVLGAAYPMGSAGRMGPGYLPRALGVLLVLFGAAAVVRSAVRRGEAVESFEIKPLVLVLGATVLFGVLVRRAGLVPAVLALVLVAGLASVRFRLAPYLALAVGMAAFCTLVFVKGLGLPLPVLGPWLGL